MATRVVLYEFVTGGGWWSVAANPPAGSLLAEGRAMIHALAEDFVRLPHIEVWTTRDSRLPAFHPRECTVEIVSDADAELAWLENRSGAADWTLLIAPETGGALARRCRLVEAAGGRLLSPLSAVVELAGDKHRTAEWLLERGVPAPRGRLFRGENTGDFRFPAVAKPIDGCGSGGVTLLRSTTDLATALCRAVASGLNDAPLRVEEYVPGLATSVAVLCGPSGKYALPPCQQRLTADGSFTYLGGRVPLPAPLAERALRLALAAVATLPEPLGYLGVDLVLAAANDGSGDRVIEINPRLTTSYVGLRALALENLAAAMLAVAAGQRPDLRFGSQPIEFTAGGTIGF